MTKPISYSILFTAIALTACASKSKVNKAGLEKYPACYHQNPKIANKCVEMNDKGQETTALQLENAAYPGQYK